MTIGVQELIEVLAKICEEKDLQAAVSESLKGGLVTGTSAVLGGLLLGPLGLALGGAIGGIASAISARDKFQPVAKILIQMPYEKKQLLCNKIKIAFSNVGPEDVMTVVMLISSNSNLKELAFREVVNFISRDMNLSIRS